jgi:hypothetical protein
MGNRRSFREERIGETSTLQCVIALEGRVEAVLALAFFANDYSGLVVADLNDVGFGHGSSVAGFAASIL